MPAETESNPAEDLRLVRAAIDGDESEVRRLCERLLCVPRIVGSLNRRMASPFTRGDLQDISQDALSHIWPKLETFEGRARLETWCYRFCFLTFMNALRRSQKLAKVERLDTSLDALSGTDASNRLLDYENVVKALDRLGPPDADVIRLKYFRDLSFREIAAILEVSATSAKTYFHRGMKQLRREIR